MRRWWRQYWRKRTLPIPRGEAEWMKQRLSVIYAFCAWNAAGIMLYSLIRHSYPMTDQEKSQPGRYYARLWQSDNVDVIKIGGFSVTGSYKIEGLPPLEPDEFAQNQNSEKELLE